MMDPAFTSIIADGIRGRRILIVSSLFPPDVLGGAEMSAANLAVWLRDHGAEVGVLTTAKNSKEISYDASYDGMRIWRVWMPRFYSQFYYSSAKAWQKPIWHIQDHVDPRNRKIVAPILDVFKPDLALVHVLQGLGYNILTEIGKRKIPTTYFLHDLALACFRMAMFKNGHECKTQCGACKLSSFAKRKFAEKIPSLKFNSPSQANLDKLAKYFPVRAWPTTVIMNANIYPQATITRSISNHLRFLYVGRLQANKGIDLLLEVFDELTAEYKFEVTVIGSGPLEATLHERYGNASWCRFTGFVSQQEITDAIIANDVMCIPSTWAENSPGVVIHALSLGLPTLGSDKGGIPELIENDKNGLLIKAGDKEAWQNSLRKIFQKPEILKNWREYAEKNAFKFNQDYLGEQIMAYVLNLKNNSEQ